MLLRSYGYALIVGALAIGGTACGGTPPAADEATASDPWAVEGSAATQSALGIESWGFRQIAPDEVAVNGYDANHQRVAEVRQRITAMDAFHWRLDLGVARADGSGMLQFDLGSSPAENGTQVTGSVGNDTLSADSQGRRILDRLFADLQAKKVGAEPSNSSSTMNTASLQPASLGSPMTLRPMANNLTNGSPGATTGDPNLIDENHDGVDDRCQQQASNQCGGNMMNSLSPVLGALGSLGQGGGAGNGELFSTLLSFVQIYTCMQGTGAAAQVKKQPIAIYDLAKCAIEQQQKQEPSSTGNNNENPLGGLMSGLSMLTGLTQAFSSMQGMGQSCPQTPQSCQSSGDPGQLTR